MIRNGFVTETAEVLKATLGEQKACIEEALDKRKACIEEIKIDMFEVQDAMKDIVLTLKLMHAELDKLKRKSEVVKPRNRSVCSLYVAVIVFFVAMFYAMHYLCEGPMFLALM